MLKITREVAGRCAEFPKERRNQNQIQKRTEMKNVSWKKKKEEEKT